MLTLLKLLAATILTLFLLLISWIDAYEHYCLALLFPFIILLLISYGSIELKMQERICLKKCYFREDTIMAKLLSSRILVTIFSVIVSVMMTITILSTTIDYSLVWWSYLLLHTTLSTILYRLLLVSSASMLQPSYHALFAREWTINLMTLLIIPIFVYFTLNGYTPLYLDDGLVQTIQNASIGVSSSCEITQSLLKWMKEIDAALWWLVSNSAKSVEPLWLKVGIWLSFITYNSLALLGINRLIIHVIYFIDRLFKRKKL